MPLLSVAFDLPPREAMRAARARRVTLAKEFYRLEPEKRAESFSVSGLAALDQVQGVMDELHKTLAKGGTLADFKRWAGAANLGLPGHRLETIFRNGVQQAYNAGHWRRFDADSEDRPYLMYDAINDSRTRPAHRALDGVIRPVGDRYWLTHSPQLGHNCRCRLLSLSADQARVRGGATQSPPAEGTPDGPGWGHKPTDRLASTDAIVERRQQSCSTPVPGALRDAAKRIDCTDAGAAMLSQIGPLPRPTAPRVRLLPGRVLRDASSHTAPFLSALGAGLGERVVRIETVDGYPLDVSARMLMDRRGRLGSSAPFAIFVAEAILRPAEVWESAGTLVHLARFVVGTDAVGIVASFERDPQTGRWGSVAGYHTLNSVYLRSLRRGRRIWPK